MLVSVEADHVVKSHYSSLDPIENDEIRLIVVVTTLGLGEFKVVEYLPPSCILCPDGDVCPLDAAVRAAFSIEVTELIVL